MIGPSLVPTSRAIAATASASPREDAGNPASMMSTRSDASCRATASFATVCMEQPGACSPSRSVVSKMRMCSVMVRSKRKTNERAKTLRGFCRCEVQIPLRSTEQTATLSPLT